MAEESCVLASLSDDLHVPNDPAEDIRGRRVRDRDGKEIGEVGDLLIDRGRRAVRLLRVDHGGLLGILATPVFVPAEAVVRVAGDAVDIDQSWFQVAAAPEYDPAGADHDRQLADLYAYYCHAPFWLAGHSPPSGGFVR
ncbi:PRC-barrel domain-containing protein [Actinoplanes sp. NPDC024001]|uniref:PRC-barrel domain-containing protein n=1 Tax=Actinoplanes sp. NPDC024001 TaxID=3154598 RepID=UPI0033FF2137